jgi:hypothetical protein
MNQKGKKTNLVQGGTNDLGNQASARSVIVPFMKTHIKNPHTGEDPIRTRTYLHPNERKRRFGTFDKL